jgi:hypothetical protein
MEWGVMESHVAVNDLHNCGKSHTQNIELLKPLKISRMFVCGAVKRYKELWYIFSQPKGKSLLIFIFFFLADTEPRFIFRRSDFSDVSVFEYYYRF